MTKIMATCVHFDNYRKTKNLFPEHLSLTTGCFFHPVLEMGIWEITTFPVRRMLKSCPSTIKIQVLSSGETIYYYLTIPFIRSLVWTALNLYSGATSLCNHQMYCPKLLSNWLEHTEDLIQADELYFHGTKAYRWKLLNSGNWQITSCLNI